MSEQAPKVIQEFPSLGPVSATLSKDGKSLMIDFVSLRDPSTALRLAFPGECLENLRGALDYLAEQMADPNSQLRVKEH